MQALGLKVMVMVSGVVRRFGCRCRVSACDDAGHDATHPKQRPPNGNQVDTSFKWYGREPPNASSRTLFPQIEKCTRTQTLDPRKLSLNLNPRNLKSRTVETLRDSGSVAGESWEFGVFVGFDPRGIQCGGIRVWAGGFRATLNS